MNRDIGPVVVDWLTAQEGRQQVEHLVEASPAALDGDAGSSELLFELAAHADAEAETTGRERVEGGQLLGGPDEVAEAQLEHRNPELGSARYGRHRRESAERVEDRSRAHKVIADPYCIEAQLLRPLRAGHDWQRLARSVGVKSWCHDPPAGSPAIRASHRRSLPLAPPGRQDEVAKTGLPRRGCQDGVAKIGVGKMGLARWGCQDGVGQRLTGEEKRSGPYGQESPPPPR